MPRLEREIMLHTAEYGVRTETGGDIRRDQSFDVTRMGDEPVVAARAEIAVVENSSAAGTHLHRQTRDRFQVDVAADGSDLNVTIANIGECDRAAHRPDMHVGIFDFADGNYRVRAFHG